MKKTKKVLFVATVDSHIELFHLPYLKMFHDKGYEVHVATDTNKPIKYCDKKICLPIKRSPFKVVANMRAVRELKKVMAREGYEIVHCHTPMGGVVARLAGRKARRNGTRMIYTAHGFHFYTGAPMYYWLMFYPVEWYLAKYTDTLITINDEDYRRAKKRFGRRCHDIQYVPGVGVDPKKFEKKLSVKEKRELRGSLGLGEGDRVLICVGRLDKNKNQGFLIRAMKGLVAKDSRYQLLLVGPDELDGKYQKLADKLGVVDHVKFLGFRKDIPELMQIADVAVSASKREGLPVNLIEAAMIGLPIVATDCRGVRDVCKVVGGAVVARRDEEDFIEKINGHAKTSGMRRVLSFGFKDVGGKMSDIYFGSKRKLLFVHGCAWLGETKNGELYNGGQYTKNVWERYYAIADEVTVILRKDDRIYDDDALIGKAQPFYGKNRLRPIKKVKNKFNIFEVFLTSRSNRKIIRNEVILSDYVVTRVPSLESCTAIKYAIKYNKKLIVEVVGCAFDSLWNHGAIGKIVAVPEFLIHRYYVRRASNVIYVTNNFLQKRYPNRKRNIGCSDAEIICNYDIRKRIKKIETGDATNKKIVLGTVGSVDVKYKGQKYVIQAMHKLALKGYDVEYQLVGSGSKTFLANIADKNGVRNKINFLGQLPHNDVIKWYDGIDIYIQPSNVEGLCRSVIEAMSAGCPCMVSDAGGNIELINEKYCFRKKSFKEIANLISSVSKKDLIEQAKSNYDKAQKYGLHSLEKKRIEFMRSCI